VTIGELLTRIRKSYIESFERRLAKLRTEHAGRLVPEPAYSLENGEVARTGSLKLPARGDLCLLIEDQVQRTFQLDAEEALTFEPLAFVWDQRLDVDLHPFTWDWCELRFQAPADASADPLARWFRRWFDEEDQRAPSNAFPGGVVHSMSEPVRDDSTWSVVIDLGSARLKAFEELFDALLEMSATHLVIGRPGGPQRAA